MSRSACVEHIAREFLEQNGFLHPITPEGAKPAPVPQEITAEMIAEAVEIVRVAHAKTLKKR